MADARRRKLERRAAAGDQDAASWQAWAKHAEVLSISDGHGVSAERVLEVIKQAGRDPDLILTRWDVEREGWVARG